MKNTTLLLVFILIVLQAANCIYAQNIRIEITTEWLQPLANEEVTVKICHENSCKTYEVILDDKGGLEVLGKSIEKVYITLKRFNLTKSIVISDIVASPIILKFDNISSIRVYVVGSRGQLLPDAVVIIRGPNNMSKTTEFNGYAEFLTLPGTYTVEVIRRNKHKTLTVELKEGERKEIIAQYDVFVSMANMDLALPDFIGMFLLIVLSIIVLFILLHEYTIWRRRKIIAKVIPLSPSLERELATTQLTDEELELITVSRVERLARDLQNIYALSDIIKMIRIYKNILGFKNLEKRLFQPSDGRVFEEAVDEFLRLYGFRTILLGTRCKHKKGELDILALYKPLNTALIIECKHVTSVKRQLSLEAVKQLSLYTKYTPYLGNTQIKRLIITNAEILAEETLEVLKTIRPPIYAILRKDLEFLFKLVEEEKGAPKLFLEYIERHCKYPK